MHVFEDAETVGVVVSVVVGRRTIHSALLLRALLVLHVRYTYLDLLKS